MDATAGTDRDRVLSEIAEVATAAERGGRVGLLVTLPLWFAAAPFVGGPWPGVLLVVLPVVFLLAFNVRTVRPSDLQGR